MSTRSVTRVFDEGTQIVNMYRQMDGYPSGHGKELYEFLSEFKFVNGLSIDLPKELRIANGAGCFAAQMIAHFKDGPGQFYLVAGSPGDHGQDYEYQIHIPFDPAQNLNIKVRNHSRKIIFEGDLIAFGVWCEKDST